MDTTNISLTTSDILDKVFEPNGKGYDPAEVDAFLDRIIEDYRSFENYYKESHAYIIDLEKQFRTIREKCSDQEIELARLKSRVASIRDDGTATVDNINLLDRIDKLERELWRLGGDPSLIK